MFRYIILILPLFVFAKDVTLEWLRTKPASTYKDFYIWRFLGQNITPQEADEAFYQTNSATHTIINRWIDKGNNKILKEYLRCTSLKPEDMPKETNIECVSSSLTVLKAISLSDQDREAVITKLKPKYKSQANLVEVLGRKEIFDTITTDNKKLFLTIFPNCGNAYREKHLNKPLPKDLIASLSKEKKFESVISLIVTTMNLDKLQQSILDIDSTTFSYDTNFFLAMNALKYNKIDLAHKYLDTAVNKVTSQVDKDKLAFWKYQLTKDNLYLFKLSQSWDLNIYSMYANEMLGLTQANIITDLPYKDETIKNFDIKDPFMWYEVATDKLNDEKMYNYFNKFNTKDTLPHLAYLLEKASNYKKVYYIRPYEEYIQDRQANRKAIIYALGKQESKFIPASLSVSYAMGMMQIMPFLSKSIAKETNQPYDIDDMFDPKINFEYADYHLNYLEKNLPHPMFMFYAYNGGIGFTKRMIESGLFRLKSPYEPFLSMELVPFSESRTYAKKVLVNYVIYKSLFNEPTTLLQQLDAIKSSLE